MSPEAMRLKEGALIRELNQISQRTNAALDAHIEGRVRQKQSSG
jgi:hypothetical protein